MLADSLNPPAEPRQTWKRFTDDSGKEWIQIYWDGAPCFNPVQGWMWDAWPHNPDEERTE